MFTWSRNNGYEVSSNGDKRFSAFGARFPNEYMGGRSIEKIYQCDVKKYDPCGINWKLGKGKPGLDLSVDLWDEYLTLWRLWSHLNIESMRDLYFHAAHPRGNNVLTDMFAKTPNNQAHALSLCLNELIVLGGPNPDIMAVLESNAFKQLPFVFKQLRNIPICLI